jgi:ASC-1-like (ASCH) protein
MSFFKGAAGGSDASEPAIPEEENAVLEKVALKVIQWRMAVPAILTLESVKPLNYIGSQMMVFFEPIIQSIFNIKEYDTFRTALERRENIENLLQKIEKYDALMYQWEKDLRKFLRQEKKKWKWYQRYLGIAKPPVVYPENLRTPPFDFSKKKK